MALRLLARLTAQQSGCALQESGGRLRHRGLEVRVHLVEEAGGGEPLLVGTDQERQVLGYEACLARVDGHLLERAGELCQVGIAVELRPMAEPARPGEDRGDRVGRGLA